MPRSYIDYAKLIDEAMHIIVRKSLSMVAKDGMKGDHHYFISFMTQAPGVKISNKLKMKYPGEMTIVLQYQFEDLLVEEDKFSVKLSFDGTQEEIVIPFDALTSFADPSVKFGLQFKKIHKVPSELNEDYDHDSATDNVVTSTRADNVITLDKFRNKNKKT